MSLATLTNTLDWIGWGVSRPFVLANAVYQNWPTAGIRNTFNAISSGFQAVNDGLHTFADGAQRFFHVAADVASTVFSPFRIIANGLGNGLGITEFPDGFHNGFCDGCWRRHNYRINSPLGDLGYAIGNMFWAAKKVVQGADHLAQNIHRIATPTIQTLKNLFQTHVVNNITWANANALRAKITGLGITAFQLAGPTVARVAATIAGLGLRGTWNIFNGLLNGWPNFLATAAALVGAYKFFTGAPIISYFFNNLMLALKWFHDEHAYSPPPPEVPGPNKWHILQHIAYQGYLLAKDQAKNIGQAIREQIYEIAKEPGVWAAWIAGEGINLISDTIPRAIWEMAKTLDAKSWSMIGAGVLAYYLLKPKPVPSLAIEYNRVTRTSKVIDFIRRNTIGRLFKKSAPQPILSKPSEIRIRNVIEGNRNAFKNNTALQNLLLEGEPGTGKTMIAEKIARESGFNYIRMSGADLKPFFDNKGSAVKKLQEILAFGTDTAYPTILFIDEIDAFAKDRKELQKQEGFSEDAPRYRDLVNTFISATGTPSNRLMIIGTTNRIEDLDSAVISRFGRPIYLGSPDQDTRVRMIKEYLDKKLPKDAPEKNGCLNASAIAKIAAKINGLSGRDIEQLVRELISVRGQQSNNQLTSALISDSVKDFVMSKRRYQKNAETSFSKRVSRALSDFWHFTLNSPSFAS